MSEDKIVMLSLNDSLSATIQGGKTVNFIVEHASLGLSKLFKIQMLDETLRSYDLAKLEAFSVTNQEPYEMVLSGFTHSHKLSQDESFVQINIKS